MLHTNNTPLAAIGFEQWQPDGTRMAVVAARASFDVVDGVIRYAGEQKLVLSDMFEGDPHRTPLTHVGDLVPFRPEADVTVLGAIHAPERTRTNNRFAGRVAGWAHRKAAPRDGAKGMGL